MEYIKSYDELVDTEPQKLDYVIIDITNLPLNVNAQKAFQNNVCQIKYIKSVICRDDTDYTTRYQISCFGDQYFEVWVDREDIIFYCKDKEDLETYKVSKKYNI